MDRRRQSPPTKQAAVANCDSIRQGTSNMAKRFRRRLWVDSKVQGSFALRAIAYWISCMMVVTGVAMLWRLLTRPTQPFFTSDEELWACVGPIAVATLFILPTIVYDILVITNRLVGPILRLRGAMRRLAQGEHVDPIRFRDGDFWQEFADEFNAVAAYVQAERQAKNRAPTTTISLSKIDDDSQSDSASSSAWQTSAALSE
jgi:hypothetical protein